MRWRQEGLILLVLLIALGVVLFPYLWTLLASFKTEAAFNRPLDWNFTPTVANWEKVLRSDIPLQARNSILVGLFTVAISLLVGSPAAYALSRFRVGGEPMRLIILAAQMLPPAALIVPFFLTMYWFRAAGYALGGRGFALNVRSPPGDLVSDRFL